MQDPGRPTAPKRGGAIAACLLSRVILIVDPMQTAGKIAFSSKRRVQREHVLSWMFGREYSSSALSEKEPSSLRGRCWFRSPNQVDRANGMCKLVQEMLQLFRAPGDGV